MRKGFWVWKEVLKEMRALSRNWEKIRNGVELHVGEIKYVTWEIGNLERGSAVLCWRWGKSSPFCYF